MSVLKPGNRHVSYHAVVACDNNYALSIVSHQGSYGGLVAKFEVAIFHDGKMCRATDITNDVMGWLDFQGVANVIKEVEALPVNDNCSHKNPEME